MSRRTVALCDLSGFNFRFVIPKSLGNSAGSPDGTFTISPDSMTTVYCHPLHGLVRGLSVEVGFINQTEPSYLLFDYRM